MKVPESMKEVLTCPTAEGLWKLRAELLEKCVPPGAPIWPILGQYHSFLDQLAACTSSRNFSDLASKLDIGSVSGVILERLLEPQTSREMALSLLTGALSEGLMALATRQHVKAWESGMTSHVHAAGWYLYGEVWRWSERMKPELPPAERRRLVDQLFMPVQDEGLDCFGKAVLLGCLFQLLLASHISDALAADADHN